MVHNIATINAMSPDNNIISADDDAMIIYVELASPELSITKSSSSYEVLPDNTVTFTIEIVNTGNQNICEIVLIYVLSNNITHIESSHSGTYHDKLHLVEWVIDEVNTDGMVTLELEVIVNADCIPGTELINIAIA